MLQAATTGSWTERPDSDEAATVASQGSRTAEVQLCQGPSPDASCPDAVDSPRATSPLEGAQGLCDGDSAGVANFVSCTVVEDEHHLPEPRAMPPRMYRPSRGGQRTEGMQRKEE